MKSVGLPNDDRALLRRLDGSTLGAEPESGRQGYGEQRNEDQDEQFGTNSHEAIAFCLAGSRRHIRRLLNIGAFGRELSGNRPERSLLFFDQKPTVAAEG